MKIINKIKFLNFDYNYIVDEKLKRTRGSTFAASK